jgi:hypothetical protein
MHRSSRQRPAPLPTRRTFLRAGFLGLGGLTLGHLARLRAVAAAPDKAPPTSVILFWLGGGPSQFETYDPKPESPAEIRGVFAPIQTTVPGLHFCELLPLQARLMNQLAVVRSIAHTTTNHAVGWEWLLTGYEVASASDSSPPAVYPSLGSVTARLRAAQQPGVAPYVLLNERKLGYHGATYLGQASNPYIPMAAGEGKGKTGNPAALTLAEGLTVERLHDRIALLQQVDRLRASADSTGALDGVDQYRRQAVGILTSPAFRNALDLEREPDKTRQRYGPNALCQHALLARRLVEAGVSFVTVSHDVWDDHGELPRKIRDHTPPFDRAFTTLIQDLSERGLLDRVLVAAFGEFGRTPVINKDAGRDHWPRVMSAALVGGGLRSGVVVGKSNGRGEEPVDTPLGPEDLLATIYHVLGIDHHQTFLDRLNRPVAILPKGEPIRQLVG